MVWPERGGKLCLSARTAGIRRCVTSGTLFHSTRQPLRDWFRAIFEVCVHRNGVSSADGGGGLSTAHAGGPGGQESIWTDNSGGPNNGLTVGPGGGGGGNGGNSTNHGGAGGGYGGGGGSGGSGAFGTPGFGASGRPGVIVIIYTP